MNPITQASNADAHLWVYLASHELYGYIGLAWVGTLCRTKTYSCSINEKLENVVSTAEVSSIFECLNTYPVRALEGYPGYPRIPQYFRLYSMNFHLKNFQKFYVLMLDTPISNF